jgi:ornithine carbamoyltransferase
MYSHNTHYGDKNMRHFLALTDYTSDQLLGILKLALQLKNEWQKGGNKPLLQNKVLAMVFQKPSLRTRISFEMAMRHLAGDALFISPAEIGLGKRESIADVSRVLSGYVDAIMARVFDHDHILELAEFASVPVINGLSDFNHPCQAMADALTMLEHFSQLEGLTLTYIGDGNNVATSLLYLAALTGMNFIIASPEGYEIPDEVFSEGISLAKESGASIHQTTDPHEAVQNAHVIYTDTWTSMGQEAEAEKRKNVFRPYQVNDQLVSEADGNVIVMHCLPAHRGEEITDEIADGENSVIFQQAENRMHAQKAILVHVLT